jgi:hypothetical protein
LSIGYASFAPDLEGLPSDYGTLNPKQRAQTLLYIKNDDSRQYKLLLAQALRCAK